MHRKLGIADLDANLILKLLDAHLRLAVFKLGTNLRGLRDAVADGNVELQTHALVGLRTVYELVESASVTGRRHTASGGATEWRAIWTAKVGGILRAAKAGAPIVPEQIERREQQTANRFLADFGISQIDACFRQFGAMTKRVIYQFFYRSNRLLRRKLHSRGRDDLSIGQSGVDQGTAQRVLHEQLL